jgi:hypothetical protein
MTFSHAGSSTNPVFRGWKLTRSGSLIVGSSANHVPLGFRVQSIRFFGGRSNGVTRILTVGRERRLVGSYAGGGARSTVKQPRPR